MHSKNQRPQNHCSMPSALELCEPDDLSSEASDSAKAMSDRLAKEEALYTAGYPAVLNRAKSGMLYAIMIDQTDQTDQMKATSKQRPAGFCHNKIDAINSMFSALCSLRSALCEYDGPNEHDGHYRHFRRFSFVNRQSTIVN
jgi:hypothetical protein